VCLGYLAMVYGVSFVQAAEQSPGQPAAAWADLKARLQANDGDAFFESNLKNSILRGRTKGFHTFTGTVISIRVAAGRVAAGRVAAGRVAAGRPAELPSEVLVAISDSTHPEVTLRFVDKQGKEDHFKVPIAPGSKIAFSGIAKTYTKDPFMLTLEVQGEDGSGPTFAVVMGLEAQGQAMPKISVNYPYSLTPRFVSISLDGLQLHKFTINDHGATTEMEGVLLERFLETAGWFQQSSAEQPHYTVDVDGVQSVATLDIVGRLGSFARQAWLTVNGKPEASLVVVNADRTVIQRVDGIRRIRVSEKQ
jgi:hypothetical protein